MNYARIIELPLTDLWLDVQPGERVLDVSSPKLMALRLAARGDVNITIGDLEDYFLDDFDAFGAVLHHPPSLITFDASRRIPFPDGHFDKVYSVSVLEHIPDGGDRAAYEEIVRVLRPGGVAVITLPVHETHYEEWIRGSQYWETVERDGRFFYQRRYDARSLSSLVDHTLTEWDYVLVAERPLRPLRIREDGLICHNSYLVDTIPAARFLKRLRSVKVPFSDWAAERIASKRCHYLTRNWSDPNIRQVAIVCRRIDC